MSCEHVSLELRSKTSEIVSSAYTNLFQTVGAQHEKNRRAAMFVDEDCVDSRSDTDDSCSVVLRVKVSERLQPEKMSLELCFKLTATDGRGAKVKR